MISLKGDRAVRFSNTIIHRIQAWWHSRSNRFAALVALFAFVSYGAGHQAWLSFGLWAACIFVALALPTYSRFSNKIDERFCRLTAWVTAGRLARFVLQFAFNLAMLGAMAWGGALDPAKVAVVGGVVALAALTTAASQGAQYVGLLLARYGVGEPMTNVQIGLSANIIATALASFGLAAVAEAYTVLALILGALGFGSGLLSDLRGLFALRHLQPRPQDASRADRARDRRARPQQGDRAPDASHRRPSPRDGAGRDPHRARREGL
jgi:hypothetical protein